MENSGMRNLAHNALPVLVVEDDADLREAIVTLLIWPAFLHWKPVMASRPWPA